jgi:uncharacterized repeat protein (TIGR01451 family)
VLEPLEDRTLLSVAIANNSGQGYTGLDFAQSGGFTPPDTCGAAGPTNYVETVNQTIAIYSPKATGASQVSDSLDHFWFTTGGLFPVDVSSRRSDPIVIYDDQIGRFIVGDQDVDNQVSHVSNFDIAVSKSSSPATLTTADWSFYAISTTESGFDADYPGNFGYNHDAFVFTLNMFGIAGGGHVQVVSVKNTDLANGLPLTFGSNLFRNDLNDFTVRPATQHNAVAGDPEWLVTDTGDGLHITIYKMAGVLSSSAIFTRTDLAVTAYNITLNFPLNPNGIAITKQIDSRILKASLQGSTLVASHSVAVSPTEDDAQWYKIDVSSGTPTLADQGRVSAGNNTYVTYPVIDINSSGQIGMTYIRSGTDSATDFMSMWVTGRLPGDSAGTMEASVLVPAGTGQTNYHDFSPTGRAGDLSGINVDPLDGSFWAANEFANTETGANWGTAIANFTLSGSIVSHWAPIGPAPIVNGQVPGGGPVSGRITGVAADPTNPNTIYVAAAGGGVWKTTNGGTTWTPLTDNQATLFMGAIAVAPSNPNVIYAGTGEANNSLDSFYGRGILKSSDGGLSWTLLNDGGVFIRATVQKIVVDPTNSNHVLAAVDDFGTNGAGMISGIYTSTDGGLTWTDTTTNISTHDEYSDLIIDPNSPSTLYMAIGTYFGSSTNGVYKSTNSGQSWSLLSAAPTGAADGRIALALSSDSSTLYVSIASPTSGNNPGVLFKNLKTTNGGNSFTDLTAGTPNYMGNPPFGQGWYDTSLAVLPGNANVVFAGGSDNGGSPGLIESTDGGAHWTNITSDGVSGPHTDSHAMAFDANGRLLEGDDGGIFRLNNPNPTALQWADLNGNLQITQFTGIALDPTNANIAYGGSQDNGTEKYTGSLGWNLIAGGDGGFTRVDFHNPSTIYQEFTGISLQRSDDGGATFVTKTFGINLSDPANFYVPYVMDPSNSSRLLLGTNRVYETTNRGDSWTPISPAFAAPIDALAVAKSNGQTIYVSSKGHIFVTLNDGVTWNQRDIPGFSDNVQDMEVDPTNSQIAYATRARFTGASGGHVFKTTDGGLTWTDISAGLPDVPTWTLAIDPLATNDLYVGTDQGVFASTDGGATWSVFGTGLPDAQVVQLELNRALNILAAGTHGRGMWEIALPSGSTGSADLSLTNASPASAVEGGTLTYTISVHNSGPGTATNVVVTDTLPAGLAFVSANFSQGTSSFNNGTVTCNLGTLGVGATVTGTIVVKLTEEGTVSNTATVSADQSDPTPLDNSQAAATNITDPPVTSLGAYFFGFPFLSLTGQPAPNQLIALFVDTGGGEAIGDYSVAIDWGDGSMSAGTIIAIPSMPGIFAVVASHTYTQPGVHLITAMIHHDQALVNMAISVALTF